MILKEYYNTPLPAGANWESPWIPNDAGDANLHSEVMANVSVLTDQAGQFSIQETDLPNIAFPNYPGASGFSVAPSVLQNAQVPMSHLWWRVSYTNGPTAQGLFDISISASGGVNLALLLELKKLNYMIRTTVKPSDDATNLPLGSL